MSKIMEFFRKLLGSDNEAGEKNPAARRMNTLMLAAAAGVLLIVLANTFGSGNNDPDETSNKQSAPGIMSGQNGDVSLDESSKQTEGLSAGITDLENLLAQRLEQALVRISGAGETRVTVNLASTTEKDYAVNTTTNKKDTLERDQKGANRTITEINEDGQIVLVRETQGSREMPVVVKELKPEVKGVIVVSEGAGNPEIKASLMMAVQVYLDVPLYKVMVLPMESR
ncbi:hypothetical protein [Phosphitispora fastidiosa]|uniref:hypothetical protein n=1 Tax=Phosphitispora fastidiosa TaxID=2837202 RepID=UPI001E2DAE36|nr:hypothetical protein [Phosphitispora fastidiosa]MBU7007632.1 stage III sporulation protein AG [Phosphitispora fastidiosa]